MDLTDFGNLKVLARIEKEEFEQPQQMTSKETTFFVFETLCKLYTKIDNCFYVRALKCL